MVKNKGRAQKKRKDEASVASAEAKRYATGSSERTRSEIPLPLTHTPPHFAAEEVDVAGAQKLLTSASSEMDVAITGVRAPSPVFPASVEPSIEEYNHASGVILRLLQGSVSKYNRATEKVKALAGDKAKLSKELAAAAAREEDLKRQLAATTTELSVAKEKAAQSEVELLAARSHEQEIAAAQGEVFRSLADRILYSQSFSALVSALTKPAKIRAVAEVLDRIAADFPNFDKGKYGHKIIDDEEMLRIYFRQLMKKASPFPVVDHLAEKRSLVSAEEIQECQFDRDTEFESLLGPFRAELETQTLSPDVSSDEEEEELEMEREAETGHVGGDVEVNQTADVQRPGAEAEPSGGVS